MYIDEQSKLDLNGVPQFVSIRREKENAPLLLYLRGAGKSYYKFEGPITIDVFLHDLHTLVAHLLSRFHQSSLYLLGHSWGSILGLRFTRAYPELVRTYIGCGQVVHMKKSSKMAYEYALEHADQKSLKRLRGIDCSYQGDNWLNDLLFVTRQVVKHKGSLYGRTNYNDLLLPFLFSWYYSLPDLIRRQKGSLQAIQFLWQEVMQTDFEAQTKYGAPVILIEGRYDYHVSSALAKEYFDRIETKKQFYWFEQSCHFPQWSESERFNQLLCELKVCSSDDWTVAALDLLGGRSGLTGKFKYSTLGIHILTGILAKTSGLSTVDFANRYLFIPLGIAPRANYLAATKEKHMDFTVSKLPRGNLWLVDSQGVAAAGYGLCMSAEEMAKIGQMCLEGGTYGGERIVSSEWISESTQRQTECDGGFKGKLYGYLWWMIDEGKHIYAAIGDSGNVLYVNPEKLTVIAVTGTFKPAVHDRIDLIQEHIEPLLDAPVSS